MQITEVRVKIMRTADDEKLKGFADITFEGFFCNTWDKNIKK